MRHALYCGNEEPTVGELLDDPIASLLRARDRLHIDDVLDAVKDARRRLAARTARRDAERRPAA